MPGTLVIAPTMSQNVLTPVEQPSIVGSKIAATDVGGFAVGATGTHPNATSIAYRFRAVKTASVSAALILTKGGTGFTAGRACFEARILTDSNTSAHTPVDSERLSVTVSGSAVRYNGTVTHLGAVSDRVELSGVSTSALCLFTWSSGKPTVSRNGIYHLEIRNVAANPNGNFDGVTTLSWAREQTIINTDQQIGVADSDLGISFRNSLGQWSARTSDTPIFGIVYDGPEHQGQGYRQPEALTAAMGVIAGPLQKVREIFVPNIDWRVNAIGFRAARWSGTIPLMFRIKNEHTNTTLVCARADYAHWPIVTNQAASYSEHRWYTRTFVSSFPLTAGVTAALELEVTAGAEYRAHTLNPSNTIGVSSQFWQGRAESTNDGATWTPLVGVAVDYDLQMFLRLGSAAPSPTCVANTLSSAVYAADVSARRVIEDETLFVNDVNPSGTSASSNFPSGINSLVLTAVNSATNCDVAISGATVNVTAKASTASFTYVAKDIFDRKSSARVTIITRSDPIINPGKKPIWLFTPTDVPADVALRYNARRGSTIYWTAFDKNTDGRFDADQGTTNNILNALPLNSTIAMAFDWEAVPNCTYGPNSMYPYSGGRHALTDSDTPIAQGEINKLVDHCRAIRPNVQYGHYYMPTLQISELKAYVQNGTIASIWGRIPGNALPCTRKIDVLYPGAYIRQKQGSSTNVSNDTVTTADALKWQGKISEIALNVAASDSFRPKVFPFASWTYYIFPGTDSLNLTVADLEWGYTWHKGLADKVVNGRQIDGLFIWDGSKQTHLNEARLKATYQALNGLPFDPDMPRP